MKKIFILLLFFGLSNSCLTVEDEHVLNDSIIGDWAYIDQNNMYTEIYIKNKSLSIYSEEFGDFLGIMKYSTRNDSLIFNDLCFAIEYQSFNRITLRNQKSNLIFTRIPNLGHDTINSINPFYIRRCSFLVNNGTVSMQEAIKYLNSLLSNDIKPEETHMLF